MELTLATVVHVILSFLFAVTDYVAYQRAHHPAHQCPDDLAHPTAHDGKDLTRPTIIHA